MQRKHLQQRRSTPAELAELERTDDATINAMLTPEELVEAERRVAAIREQLRTERIVANCVANQSMEGLVCVEEDKVAVRRIVSGETTVEDEVAKVLAKYRKP